MADAAATAGCSPTSSIMGMGEPLLNYDATAAALRLAMDETA